MSEVEDVVDPIEQSVENGSDRRKYIGGSDVAAVLGLSPWTTPLKLARLKRGETYHYGDGDVQHAEERDLVRKKALLRGHRWEAVVREMLVTSLIERGHQVSVTSINRRYEDPEHPFLACEIDYEMILDGELVNGEIKTVHPFKAKEWGEEGTDEVPVHYTAQVLHGMGITGRKRTVFGVLFGADDMVPYVVDRDDEMIAEMRARCVEFWQRFVLGGADPDPLTWTDLLVRFQPPQPQTVEVDDAAYSDLLRLRTVQSKLAAYEREVDELKFRIGCYSKGAGVLTRNGNKVAEWKLKNWSTLNFDRLKAEHASLYKELQIKGSTPTLGLIQGGFDQ